MTTNFSVNLRVIVRMLCSRADWDWEFLNFSFLGHGSQVGVVRRLGGLQVGISVSCNICRDDPKTTLGLGNRQ